MIEDALFYLYYALTLFFGIILSLSFCGLHLTKKNLTLSLITFAFCGVLQVTVFHFFGEANTWKFYPLIAHLPLGILLCTVFKKRVVS